MLNSEDNYKVLEAERIMEYNKWVKEIPYLELPNNIKIKVIPPFARAVCRFQLEYKDNWCSVYLDCYDCLGSVGEPYWEVYPYEDDVFRCSMNDTYSLIKAIKESLKYEN